MRRFLSLTLALSLAAGQTPVLAQRSVRGAAAVPGISLALPAVQGMALPGLDLDLSMVPSLDLNPALDLSLDAAPVLETAGREALAAPKTTLGAVSQAAAVKAKDGSSRETRQARLFDGALRAQSPAVDVSAAAFAGAPTLAPNRMAKKGLDTDAPDSLSSQTTADTAAAERTVSDKEAKDANSESELQPSIIFAGHMAMGLVKSRVWGKLNLVKNTPGSRWWWGRFKKGVKVDILLGGEKLKAFTTEVTDSRMVPISKLTKADLEGIIPDRILARNPIAAIRSSIRRDMAERYRLELSEFPMASKIKLVKFKPYSEVLDEHEKKEQIPNYDPYAPRQPLKLAEDNPLRRMQQFHPKSVIVDLDLFGTRGEAIPPEILADMGKLQRAGVKFGFVSDTPGADHGVKKQQIRDALYGSVFAFDGGAIVVENRSDRHIVKEANTLTPYDRQTILAHAQAVAFARGDTKVVELERQTHYGKKPIDTHFSGKLSKGADAAAFATALEERLRGFGFDYRVNYQEGQGNNAPRFQVQQIRIAKSMAGVLRTLQDMGVYQNPQEILVISENQSIIDSVTPAHETLLDENGLPAEKRRKEAELPNPDVVALTKGELHGAELADNALGAVLGEYRENHPGDFVSSASAMTSFNSYKARFFEQDLQGFESNVYAHAGHMTHETMNWVAWMQRNGRLPTKKEALDRMERMWIESHLSQEDQVYLGSQSLEGFIKAFRKRLENIYDHYVSIMMEPGVELLGTELPNIFMLTKVDKKTGERKRYFVRAIFDWVAYRRRPDGSVQLMILDFKSGIQPTMRKLSQDIQPNLYHLFSKYKWHSVPQEYQVAGGVELEVGPREHSDEYAQISFIYSPNYLTPELDNWSQNRTEFKATKLMDGMQKEKGRMTIRKKRKRTAAAKPAPKKPTAAQARAEKEAQELKEKRRRGGLRSPRKR